MSAPRIRHFTRRAPRKCDGFTWARVPLGEGAASTVSYRLFLRCSERRSYMQIHTFAVDAPRIAIARQLRGMRLQLRWTVDQIEFARLGLVDTTPRPQQVAA